MNITSFNHQPHCEQIAQTDVKINKRTRIGICDDISVKLPRNSAVSAFVFIISSKIKEQCGRKLRK